MFDEASPIAKIVHKRTGSLIAWLYLWKNGETGYLFFDEAALATDWNVLVQFQNNLAKSTKCDPQELL